jgi:hypothetical protein
MDLLKTSSSATVRQCLDRRATPTHREAVRPATRVATALKNSSITAAVDYAADGIQQGFLRLPYSRDDSAWGGR